MNKTNKYTVSFLVIFCFFNYQVSSFHNFREIRKETQRISHGKWLKMAAIAPDEDEISLVEERRQKRRTVYDFNDWKKHRSESRFIRNLSTMLTSGVIINLWNEVLAVTAVALFAVVWNDVFGGEGVLPLAKDLPVGKLVISPLPFTLCTSALSLLLVFRTNSAYDRWKEARVIWAGTIQRSLDLVRSGLTYFGNQDATDKDDTTIQLKKELTLKTVAFVRCLKGTYREGKKEQSKLREELIELLGAEEAEYVLSADHRTLRLVQELSNVLQRAKLTPMQLARMDSNISFFCDAIGVCERIFKTPIPLFYTRHTSRFLSVWLLLLPFALYNVLGDTWLHFATIPASSLIAIFFLGIEELGIQIEEPFSILPMEAMCDGIERNCKEMLFNDLE